MKIQINTEKFNEALHHITKAINILQVIRAEFLDSIQDEDQPIQKEEKQDDYKT